MFTNRTSKFLILIGLGFTLSISSCTDNVQKADAQEHIDIPITFIPNQNDTITLQDVFAYCDDNNFSKELAILVNLAPHSGNFRLFAINLLTQDTLIRGLVAHGHCKGTEDRFATFSNEIGSNCSSLGHYAIGGHYTGSFGSSFKLTGLDSCNSNAQARFVVLHGHPCIPNEEQEDDICLSQGCPTVSPEVLEQLEPMIENSSKPVLLWIYD
ncbi:MAG: hypothetical protein HKP14_10810 [Bacteroidia bacterium]|nr:hypothetical protein [Bacteroidia bacterium]